MKRYLVALLALMPVVLAAQTAKVDTMVRTVPAPFGRGRSPAPTSLRL